MTDSVKEQLSACLDGELPETELDLLLKRVGRDAELRGSIGRYALIAEVLQAEGGRAEKPAGASRAFAANVIAAIEREPAPARPAMRVSPAIMRRLRPAAGIAIAAGVAAIAVVSVQRIGLAPQVVAVNQPVATPPAQPEAQSADNSPSYIVPTTVSSPSFVPAARLTNYVVAHSEYSSPLGRRTVLSGVLAEDDAAVPEDLPAPAQPSSEQSSPEQER